MVESEPVHAAVERVVEERVEDPRVRSPRRRRADDRRRHQKVRRTRGCEPDERRRLAGEHLGPVEGQGGVGALVRAHVVRVRPDADLEVVGECRRRELVTVVRARRVGSLRDGDAYAIAIRELREEPAVRHPVVDGDRISVRGGGAAAAGPEQAQLAGPRNAGPRLVEDLNRRGIDHLHVVVRTDCADGVRGRAAAGVSLAVDGQGGRGCPDGAVYAPGQERVDRRGGIVPAGRRDRVSRLLPGARLLRRTDERLDDRQRGQLRRPQGRHCRRNGRHVGRALRGRVDRWRRGRDDDGESQHAGSCENTFPHCCDTSRGHVSCHSRLPLDKGGESSIGAGASTRRAGCDVEGLLKSRIGPSIVSSPGSLP